MKRLLLVMILPCFFACQNKVAKKQEVVTQHHEDGRAKPVVAIVPLIDSTSTDIPWSLSEELTQLIKNNVQNRQLIFLPPADNLGQKISYQNNPFGTDLTWAAKEFDGYEFVVFLELTEHSNRPVTDATVNESIHKHDISTNLDMDLRMRIVDLRGKSPKIILQEKITDSYYISKNLIPPDYNKTIWGSNNYQTTPLGLAHQQLSKEIAMRIHDYITLAKTR